MPSLPDEQRFEIGEIAIFAKAIWNPVRVGQEVVILDELAVREIRHVPTGEYYTAACHRVRFADGHHARVHPWQLRKKRLPPRNFARELTASLLRTCRIPEEETSHVQ